MTAPFDRKEVPTGDRRARRGARLAQLYLAYERAVLGVLVLVLVLVFWEGLARGWWTDLLRPILGAAAERWTIKPIFISSPTRIATAAYRMFVVTG